MSEKKEPESDITCQAASFNCKLMLFGFVAFMIGWLFFVWFFSGCTLAYNKISTSGSDDKIELDENQKPDIQCCPDISLPVVKK